MPSLGGVLGFWGEWRAETLPVLLMTPCLAVSLGGGGRCPAGPARL